LPAEAPPDFIDGPYKNDSSLSFLNTRVGRPRAAKPRRAPQWNFTSFGMENPRAINPPEKRRGAGLN
jgi:hypothetical protein